jgi:hypothetical protein
MSQLLKRIMPVANNLWSELKPRINQTWLRVKPAANMVWGKLKNVASNPLIQGAWNIAKGVIPQLNLVDEGIQSLDRLVQSDDIVQQLGREGMNLAGRIVNRKNPFITGSGGSSGEASTSEQVG